MAEINVESDLTSVTEQIGKLVEELNRINAAREQLVQQVQNLNGVAMYLLGKVPTENETTSTAEVTTLERSVEYPEPIS